MINKFTIENFFLSIRQYPRSLLFVWFFFSAITFYVLFTFIFNDEKENFIRQPLIFTDYVTKINNQNSDYVDNEIISTINDEDYRQVNIDNNLLTRTENIETAILLSSLDLDVSFAKKNIFFIKGQSNINIFQDYFNDQNIVPFIKRLSIDPKAFDAVIRESVKLSRPLNELIVDIETLGLSEIQGRVLIENLIKVINNDLEKTFITNNNLKKISLVPEDYENPIVLKLKLDQIEKSIAYIEKKYSNVANEFNIQDLLLSLTVLNEELIKYYTSIQYDEVFLSKMDLEIKGKTRQVENITKAIKDLEYDTSFNVNLEDETLAKKNENSKIVYDGDALNQITRLISGSSLSKVKSELIYKQISLSNDLAKSIDNKEAFVSLRDSLKKINIANETITSSINNLTDVVNDYIDVISIYESNDVLVPASNIIIYESNNYTQMNLLVFIIISMFMLLISNLIIIIFKKDIKS